MTEHSFKELISQSYSQSKKLELFDPKKVSKKAQKDLAKQIVIESYGNDLFSIFSQNGMILIPLNENGKPIVELSPYFYKAFLSPKECRKFDNFATKFGLICSNITGVRCIDVDLKNDKQKTITCDILKHVEDLKKYFYVETTKTGGVHVIFKNKLKNPLIQHLYELLDKWHKYKIDSKNIYGFIDCITNKHYVVVAPSKGYKPFSDSNVFEDIQVVNDGTVITFLNMILELFQERELRRLLEIAQKTFKPMPYIAKFLGNDRKEWVKNKANLFSLLPSYAESVNFMRAHRNPFTKDALFAMLELIEFADDKNLLIILLGLESSRTILPQETFDISLEFQHISELQMLYRQQTESTATTLKDFIANYESKEITYTNHNTIVKEDIPIKNKLQSPNSTITKNSNSKHEFDFDFNEIDAEVVANCLEQAGWKITDRNSGSIRLRRPGKHTGNSAEIDINTFVTTIYSTSSELESKSWAGFRLLEELGYDVKKSSEFISNPEDSKLRKKKFQHFCDKFFGMYVDKYRGNTLSSRELYLLYKKYVFKHFSKDTPVLDQSSFTRFFKARVDFASTCTSYFSSNRKWYFEF